MQAIPFPTPQENDYTGKLLPEQNRLFAFNRQLDQDVQAMPNEDCLAQRLEDIMGMQLEDPRIYWLTLARIAELTLKQAGDYADNCEFQSAGDLLVNPRRVEVCLNGVAGSVVKHRHQGLSDQFATVIGDDNPVAWLSRNSFPLIRTKALIPRLRQMLASSGVMKSDYLADLDRRLCQVADTIAFLISWKVSDSDELFLRIKNADKESESFILTNLCQFDLEIFQAMGSDIQSLLMNNRCSNAFLCCKALEAYEILGPASLVLSQKSKRVAKKRRGRQMPFTPSTC